MSDTPPAHDITTGAKLDALQPAPKPVSAGEEIDRLTTPYRAIVETAPFRVLASARPERLDASPRVDAPDFVRVSDGCPLALPDRHGNSRIGTLRTVVCDPRVALLFLVA